MAYFINVWLNKESLEKNNLYKMNMLLIQKYNEATRFCVFITFSEQLPWNDWSLNLIAFVLWTM